VVNLSCPGTYCCSLLLHFFFLCLCVCVCVSLLVTLSLSLLAFYVNLGCRRFRFFVSFLSCVRKL
jgi:hypothetical protein